jgi:ferrochelatase
VDGVLVCPAGFVSDHLEVLYDIDIDAAAVARQVGLRLERTTSFNDDPRFIARLAAMVREVAPVTTT